MSPEYWCTACGTRFSFEAVRHVARCLECGAGLWREPPPGAGSAADDRPAREPSPPSLSAPAPG